MLRIFDAGHQFERLSIRWLRAAGFDLRDKRKDGAQFGFEAAGSKPRGHIDGVIVGGPDVGVRWPALWEHKAFNAKSWSDLVKRGLASSKPVFSVNAVDVDNAFAFENKSNSFAQPISATPNNISEVTVTGVRSAISPSRRS